MLDHQADFRINWRVTAKHDDYLIHIMALDRWLNCFACCLQSKVDFDERQNSDHRVNYVRYEESDLAGLKVILDDIYARFSNSNKADAVTKRKKTEPLKRNELNGLSI